ncbi:hypothetical protein ACVNIS_14735 [Sphaerotilaceae bacterium SBD11-9]
MPHLTAPAKTPAGLDELRHRTRGLGQRYRTVLLLVDGRRPLGEVLGMAHKAGAQTSHFEELVRMGLVEIPDDVQAPEPVETLSGALDTPRLTSVDVDVFSEAALTPMGELLPEEDDEPDTSAPLAPTREAYDEQEDEPVARFSEIALAPVTRAVPVLPPVPPPTPVPAPAPAARYVEPTVQLHDTPRAPDWVQQARETPFKVADHARAAPKMTDEQRLQYVRDLLIDTVRRDSLFATFSLGRVRAALTHKELIKLVWELERDRAHARRNRDQLLNLQRARELLGMGNTLVAGDSQAGAPSEY